MEEFKVGVFLSRNGNYYLFRSRVVNLPLKDPAWNFVTVSAVNVYQAKKKAMMIFRQIMRNGSDYKKSQVKIGA